MKKPFSLNIAASSYVYIKRFRLYLFFFIFMTVFAPACATIFRANSSTQVALETIPEASTVTSSTGVILCQETPCTLQTSAIYNEKLTISKPGFHASEKVIKKRFSKLSLLNILFLHPLAVGLCFGIDYFSGALTHFPDNVLIKLQEVETLEADEVEANEPEVITPKEPLPPQPTSQAQPPPAMDLPKELPSTADKKFSDLPLVKEPEEPSVKKRFPPATVEAKIAHYYGYATEKESQRIAARLYKILEIMIENGEPADLDEAIRRDLD